MKIDSGGERRSKAREGGGLVLVADDEADVRDVTSRMLERLNYQVETAQDADEALAVFARRKDEFTAVILDLKMPGKDGWQCLTEMRAIRRDIPVVICTGFDPAGASGEQAAQRGASFLSKPFRLTELQSVLSDLLEA